MQLINPFKKKYIKIHKNIVFLAIPSMIALIAEPMLGIVDTALVGHLGTLQLSVLAIITTFFSSITWLFGLFVSGTTASISTLNGEKRYDDMRSFFIQNQMLALIIGILLGIFCFFIEKIAFSIMGGDSTQLKIGNGYYMIRLFSFPFIFSYYVSMGFLRGMKDMKTPMVITLTINVVNAILDYYFIYGVKGIIPEWGLSGAAMATLFSQIGAATIYMIIILKNYKNIFFVEGKKIFKFNSLLLKSMFKINRNMFFRSLYLLISLTVATAVASRMGKVTVSSHQVGMQMWLFCSFAMDSFAIAAQTICGSFIGKRKFKLLHLYGVFLQYWGLFLGILFSLIFILLKKPLILLFTNDKAVIEMISSIFIYIIIYQPIGGIIFILDGILVGTLDTFFLMWQSFFTAIVVFVPALLYVYKIQFGIIGIWISLGLFLISRLILNEYRFITKKYINLSNSTF